MLTDEDITQVNKLLSLCDTYAMNQHEIDLANKIGAATNLSGLLNWAVFVGANDTIIIPDQTQYVGGELAFQTALTECQYYTLAQNVMEYRSITDTTMQASLETLKTLGAIDGCEIILAPEIVPEVNIPYFGGGL